MSLVHTGPCGERIELTLSDADEESLAMLLLGPRADPADLMNVLGLMARNPELVSRQENLHPNTHPILSILSMIYNIRELESGENIRELAKHFPDHNTVASAEAYLETLAGNLTPLRARFQDKNNTTIYDRLAILHVFAAGSRSIEGVLPQLLPRGNRARALELGRIFGVRRLQPMILRSAMASQRRPAKRIGSWKTVYERWRVAREYERLRKTMDGRAAKEVIGDLGLRSFRPSEKTTDAAITQARQRAGPYARSPQERAAILKMYLSYRKLSIPHNR